MSQRSPRSETTGFSGKHLPWVLLAKEKACAQDFPPGSGLKSTWKAGGLLKQATFNQLWATLGYSGQHFWATWLSR